MRGRAWKLAWIWAIAVAALAGLALGLARAADETPTVVDLPLSDPFAPCDAVEPHIAASAYDVAGGTHYVAAVWVQELGDGETCTNGGEAFLRWAEVVTQATATDWEGPVDPFQGLLAADELVAHVDVAVSVNVAHLVAVTKQTTPGASFPVTTSLRYAAYDLTSGSRIAHSTIRTEVANSTDDMQILEAVITVGDDGVPHIAYSRRQTSGDDSGDLSEVWYTRPLTGSWSIGINLTSDSSLRHAYHPQIAWSRSLTAPYQGYVHFTWGFHKASTSDVSEYDGDVYYRRCLDDAVESGAIVCGDETLYADQTPNNTHPRPTVAAQGDTVALVWNQCVSLDPNPPCELFALIYRMSGRSGGDFAIQANNNVPPYEVISNNRVDFGTYSYKYVGTDDEGIEYGSYLRPSAFISPTGGVFVAWQIVSATIGGSDAHYWPSVLSTTWGYSPSVSLGKFSLWKGRGWVGGNYTDARFLPEIAQVPTEIEPQGGLHMIFMRSEDVNGVQRYRIEYTYFNEDYVPPGTGGENEDPYPYDIYLPLVLRNR